MLQAVTFTTAVSAVVVLVELGNALALAASVVLVLLSMVLGVPLPRLRQLEDGGAAA